MINKFDIKKMEAVFSEDFSSSLYSFLSEEYLAKKDFGRAYTVCKIGLENNPEDISGQYILSKLHLLKGEISKTKALLEEVLERFPLHLNARKLMIEILKKQKGNSKRLAHHIGELQEYFPELSTITEDSRAEQSKKTDVATFKENKIFEAEKEPVNIDKKFTIKKNMATFTLADILVGQKNYNQALKVLNILEKQGKNKSRINKTRSDINKKINND
ncbi:MAG: hypothetical protein CMG00_09395 [Candidatus Marinimicrobia bacterium]|nr:hypothetical protein [Candidatus Neomarinimicrobiota bacterium]|tara:strand:+ start:720 stop:1370 length:651 start_codon:yes stop_codon:yes gene_type:complete